MIRWVCALAVLVIGLAAPAVASGLVDQTYTYRYRLTVNVMVDGTLHSGSSVIEVTWADMTLQLSKVSPELRGQATLVDLGSRGVIVATLINGEDYGPAKDGAWGALWIAGRAFGLNSIKDELPRLPELRGKRDLAPDNLPRFLWFPNPQVPTARKILAPEFSAVGPSVQFAGATVEITSDPIVIDIRDKLPWLKALEQRSPGSDIIYLQDAFPISRYLFIGDRS